MRNSVLPQISPQLYANGYTDNVSDLPMHMESKLNANDTSFYVDSNPYSQEDQFDGLFGLCSQVPVNYQPGMASQMNIRRLDQSFCGETQLTFKPQVVSLTATSAINQYGICNTRKRPLDNANVFQQKNPQIIEENKATDIQYWPANKKISLCFQGQPQGHLVNNDIKQVNKDRAPARRSQKLADRITALQKLVSPYGKTDTASVLHEASIFIKALQDQIENMFHTQNSSPHDENSPQANVEKQYNLQNKGLCLIPLSKTEKLMEEEDALYHFYSPDLSSSPLSPDNLSTFM